jgi:hypothetical protein
LKNLIFLCFKRNPSLELTKTRAFAQTISGQKYNVFFKYQWFFQKKYFFSFKGLFFSDKYSTFAYIFLKNLFIFLHKYKVMNTQFRRMAEEKSSGLFGSLKNVFDSAKDMVEDALDTAKDKLEDGLEALKENEFVNNVIEKGSDFIDSAKDKIEDGIDAVKDNDLVNNVIEKGSDFIDSAKDKIEDGIDAVKDKIGGDKA